jgi:hypothetical protein
MSKQPKVVVENLFVDLTDEEVSTRGEELAKCIQRQLELKDEKKKWAEEWKTRFAVEERRAGELSKTVETRRERRPVECEERPHGTRGTVELYRKDTGEFVTSRPMTTNEKEEWRNPQMFDS